MAWLDDGWRPNQSGILILQTDQSIPDEYDQKTGLIFVFVGGFVALFHEGVVGTIVAAVSQGIPTFMAVSYAQGSARMARTFLNPFVDECIRDGRVGTIQDMIVETFMYLRSKPGG
jgi:hypothetical protein